MTNNWEKTKKEIDKKFKIWENEVGEEVISIPVSFLKAKIEELMDDMIGEERKHIGSPDNVKSEVWGYNSKVQELKEYKKQWLG